MTPYIAKKRFAVCRLKYWQKRLNLPDWEIKLKYVDEIDHLDPDTYLGCCHIEDKNKKATVTVKARGGEGVEATIIHELLHIVLQSLTTGLNKNGYEYNVCTEQIIEALTKALMTTEREGV